MAIYVDDGLAVSSSNKDLKEPIMKIQEKFQIKITPGDAYVGIEIMRDKRGIYITQTKLIKEVLEKLSMMEAKPGSVPMQQNLHLIREEKNGCQFPYQELIRSHLFIARISRPDIAFAVAKLSQFNTCYDGTHVSATKLVLCYLRGTFGFGLLLPATGSIVLQGFTDADYAADRTDRKSQSEFAFYIRDALVSWKSAKQNVVSTSSCESEYIAVYEGVNEAIWLISILQQFGFIKKELTSIYCDSTSAINLSINLNGAHKQTKHIEVKYHFNREAQSKAIVDLQQVRTEDQRADIFTKPLQPARFKKMRKELGVTG